MHKEQAHFRLPHLHLQLFPLPTTQVAWTGIQLEFFELDEGGSVVCKSRHQLQVCACVCVCVCVCVCKGGTVVCKSWHHQLQVTGGSGALLLLVDWRDE